MSDKRSGARRICAVVHSSTSAFADASGSERDIAALTTALRLGAQMGAEVTAVGVFAAHHSTAVCQEALDLGCNEALCLRTIVPVDFLGAATLLSVAIRELEADLVLCGDHFPDNGSGAVGAALAKLLDRPHLGGLMNASWCEGSIHVTRRSEAGLDEYESPEQAVLALLETHEAVPLTKRTSRGVLRELTAKALLHDDSILFDRAGQAGAIVFSAATHSVELFSEPMELLSRLRQDKLWEP